MRLLQEEEERIRLEYEAEEKVENVFELRPSSLCIYRKKT